MVFYLYFEMLKKDDSERFAKDTDYIWKEIL
nr:hypothetical protein [Mucilaginibacter sp. FT3.2]